MLCDHHCSPCNIILYDPYILRKNTMKKSFGFYRFDFDIHDGPSNVIVLVTTFRSNRSINKRVGIIIFCIDVINLLYL